MLLDKKGNSSNFRIWYAKLINGEVKDISEIP